MHSRDIGFRKFTSGPPFPHHHPPRVCSGVLAILEHLDTVDENVDDAGGELHRLFVGRLGGDGDGVEDDDVGEIAWR